MTFDSVTTRLRTTTAILALMLAAVLVGTPTQAEDTMESDPAATEGESMEEGDGENGENGEGTAGGIEKYVKLEPRFTVNYLNNGNLRYMTLSVSVLVNSNNAAIDVNIHSDALRHEIIMLVSSKDGEAFRTSEGRARLRKELKNRMQAVLEKETGEPIIQDVFITELILQG